MIQLLIASIRLYQKTLSPDHGWLRFFYPNGYCQYYPSCSAFAHEALLRHRYRGILMSVGRVLRCNPWSKGGIDRVSS